MEEDDSGTASVPVFRWTGGPVTESSSF